MALCIINTTSNRENILNNKKRFRFSAEDDMILLKEIVSANPFEDGTRWQAIQDVIKERSEKHFSLRALKEHFDLLSNKFNIKDDKNKKKTGEEETYSEYDHLLTQIRDMMRERNFGIAKSSTTKLYEKNCIEKGRLLREKCLLDFKKELTNRIEDDASADDIGDQRLTETQLLQNSSTVTPKTKVKAPIAMEQILTPQRQRQPKRLRNSALEYLNSKQERENNIRTKELELESRRLDIEERKVKLEEERLSHEIDMNKKRLELEAIKVKMEQAERGKVHSIIDNYDTTLKLLLQKMK